MHLGVDFKLWEYYFQQKGVDVGYLEADFGPFGDQTLALEVNFRHLGFNFRPLS